jgi:hypothetical protein
LEELYYTTGQTTSNTSTVPARYTYSNLASLSLTGGSSGNTFYVFGTTADTPTTIAAGSGPDQVNLGDATHVLDAIHTLTVNGALNTLMTVDDESNVGTSILGFYQWVSTPVYNITDLAINRSNTVVESVRGGQEVSSTTYPSTIDYADLGSLTFKGGQNRTVWNISSTANNMSTVIDAGMGIDLPDGTHEGDAVTVGDSQNFLMNTNNLTVHGGNGTTLTLDDRANQNTSTPEFGSDNTLDVDRTATFTLADGSVIHSDVVSEVEEPSSTTLFTDPPVVSNFYYDHIAGLTVMGGSSGNIYDVVSTTAGMMTTIDGGSGDDTFSVSSSGSTLDPIAGPVTLDGQGGNNQLTVSDAGNSSNEWYEVYASTITRATGSDPSTPTQTINYSNFATVNLYGGSGQDGMAAESTTAGTTTNIDTNSGINYDELFVSNNSDTMDDIQGPVNFHGNHDDLLFLVDDLNTTGHTYTLDTSMTQRDGIAPISYSGVNELVLEAGDNPYTPPSPDTVNVYGTPANALTVVAVGTGDTVIVGRPVDTGGRTMQDIQGTFRVQSISTEAANVVYDDSGDTNTAARTVSFEGVPYEGITDYEVDGLAPTTIQLGVGTGSSISFVGSAADETFAVQALPQRVNISLNGGGGYNVLDYSSFTGGDVSVDLSAGTATGFSNGISNIQNYIE